MAKKQVQVNARVDEALLSRFHKNVPQGERSDFVRDAITEKLDGGAKPDMHGLVKVISDWRQYDFSKLIRDAREVRLYVSNYPLFLNLFQHQSALRVRASLSDRLTYILSAPTTGDDPLAGLASSRTPAPRFAVATSDDTASLPSFMLAADTDYFDAPYNTELVLHWNVLEAPTMVRRLSVISRHVLAVGRTS